MVQVDDLRFVVTDRSNHRVVLMDEKGHVVHTVGSGEAGIKQGEFADPRGLCWDQRNKARYGARPLVDRR